MKKNRYMNKEQFRQKLSIIRTATSVTGKEYKIIQIVGENVEFVRVILLTVLAIAINTTAL